MIREHWKGLLEEWMRTRLDRKELPALLERHRLHEELGIDSVMLLQLLVWMEVELGLPVPEREIDPTIFHTVGSLIDFMESIQGCKDTIQ